MTTSNSATVTDLRCNNCGASLQVPPDVRFVTCPYCGSSLEVHRSGDGVYTEVLQKLAQTTEHMAEQLELVQLNQQLDALDDEWERERQTYMISGKNGRMREPSDVGLFGYMVGMGVAGIFALMGLTGAFGDGSVGFFLVAAIGFILMLFSYLTSSQKIADYRDAHDRYQTKRDQLKTHIQHLEREAKEHPTQ